MATQRACVFAPHALCDVRHTVRARARALLRFSHYALCAANNEFVHARAPAHRPRLRTSFSCGNARDGQRRG